MRGRGAVVVAAAGVVTVLLIVVTRVALEPGTVGASAPAVTASGSAETISPSPLTTTVDYPAVGVHLSPPGVGEIASTSATTALDVYRRQGSPPGLEQVARPVIRLVKLTHDSYGGDAPMGTAAPRPYADVLSWDISFAGYEGVPAGGVKQDGTAMDHPNYRCELHYLVDATNGAELISWENCGS